MRGGLTLREALTLCEIIQGYFLMPNLKFLTIQKNVVPEGALIFKLLRSPRIDSKESIPSAYVAWRAGTTTLPGS